MIAKGRHTCLLHEEDEMKILIILGSRNPKGQTARAANALKEGAFADGNKIEQVFLPKINIESCRQCQDDGWGTCRSKGKCTIEDDFKGLVDKIKAADTIIFANPVYFSDLSESLKSFLDRLRRICMHEAGKDRITGKKAVGICVAGGGGGGAPECTIRLERVLQTCGFDVVDMVPARRQNLEMKLEVLKTVGKWLST